MKKTDGKKMSFLGIIPARGGSKGIPRKNIKMIAGRPLMAWTIDAAKESRLLNDFFVSTEDAEIACISRDHGAKVVERSRELAADDTPTVDVLKHILSSHEADAIVLLQPTSPIRDKALIDNCIRQFISSGADNLATGFICKYMEYGTCGKRRQELKGFFYDDGNVYVIKSKLIRRGKMFGKKACRVITDRESNIEIDDNFDFWMAEQALFKRMGKKAG